MALSDLAEKVANLPPPSPDRAEVPLPEVVGFFVAWVRGMRRLKKAALADMARVSLATVERIERGEKVRAELLDRVGAALGYEKGYLTEPRLPRSQSEACENLVNTWGELEPVAVRPLRTQSQVRALAQCHCFLPHAPEGVAEHQASVRDLAEWLDLASFILSDTKYRSEDRRCSRRKLYLDILRTVSATEKSGCNVLAGVMNAPQMDIPDWKVAVLCVTSKMRDPGAPKRRCLLVDKRCVDIRLRGADLSGALQ